MAQIEVLLERQMLSVVNQEIISSGDISYDTCRFSFDGTWDGFAKTGVFYQDKKNVQYAVLEADGSCMIPAQAMAREGNMYIGVFGVNGSSVMTSTVERVYIRQGAISGDTVSTEPSDDVFLAIIAQYQRMAEMMQGYDATAAELSEMLRDMKAYDVSEVLRRLEEVEKAAGDAQDRIDFVSGGLRFGTDENGNWGYIVPGGNDVIAFGVGRAEDSEVSLNTYRWQAVECDDCFVEDGRSWTADMGDSDRNNKKHLFLAVKVPEGCKTIVNIISINCSCVMYLNDELVYDWKAISPSNTSDDFRETLTLVKGVNYIFLECWHSTVTTGGSVNISFAPIVA